jgi:hypothetical protein
MFPCPKPAPRPLSNANCDWTYRDPVNARRTDKAAKAKAKATNLTFDACCDAYIASHRAGWRNVKHQKQWTSTLKAYASPITGKIMVRDVDIELITQVIEPLWTTKTQTASRLRRRIESVLDWAKVRGYREGENPARWRGHFDKLLPKPSKVTPERASSGPRIFRNPEVHGRAAVQGRRCRPGTRVCRSNSHPDGRGDWRDVDGNRPGRTRLDSHA